MNYDELKKALREDNACLSVKTLHEAADAIEELANWWSMAKTLGDMVMPKWIPVTEQLPEPGVPCLCWCKGGTYGQIRWYGLYYLTSHRTWAFYDNDCIDNREVTHWMYRPEPPKEETE